MNDSTSPRRHLADFPAEEVLRDYTDHESGLRLLVRRGLMCFCAYVGVEAGHALAGLEELEFDCHCNVNIQGWGAGEPWTTGWYWWGWDYGHAGDVVAMLPLENEFSQDLDHEQCEAYGTLHQMRAGLGARSMPFPRKNWTVDEVFEDGLDVLMNLRQALRSSEELASLISMRPS